MAESTFPSLPDAELARRIAAGGAREAERELCVRFARRIRLYGLRHLGDEPSAADLVQQVLLHVLEALRAGRVEDPALIDRFVLGTCRHVAGKMRRHEHRRAELPEELEDAIVPGPVALDHHRVVACVLKLAERERKVILMTFQDDCSAEEIAGALATTAGNVRVIRHRALRNLHTCMEGPR